LRSSIRIINVFRIEKRELLLSEEGSRTNQVAASGSFLALPSKNAGETGSLFACQTAVGLFHFRLGKTHKELRWWEDEARRSGQHALAFLDVIQCTLERSVKRWFGWWCQCGRGRWRGTVPTEEGEAALS
jgi:hypothetical protein